MDQHLGMIDEMRALAESAPHFNPRKLKDPNRKWLVRSGLQKAIRRGRTEEALKCGEYLMGEDPSYAWGGLATVIVEDIGFADLDLLSYSMVTGLQSVLVKIEEPRRLYAGMVARACKGMKTRSCCELSLGADKSEHILRAVAHSAPWENLMDDLFGETKDLATRYVAAVELRKRARGTTGQPLLMSVLKRMMDEAPNAAAARASMLTFERSFDTMCLSTWPLIKNFYGTMAAPKQPAFGIQMDQFPDETTILGLSSAAFDMHVSTGKKAIKAFHTSMMKKHDLFIEFGKRSEDVVRGLGALIFILEGGQEDQRLMSDELAALKEYQDRHFAVAFGVPEPMLTAMTELVAESFDVLNEKRAWAAAL